MTTLRMVRDPHVNNLLIIGLMFCDAPKDSPERRKQSLAIASKIAEARPQLYGGMTAESVEKVYEWLRRNSNKEHHLYPTWERVKLGLRYSDSDEREKARVLQELKERKEGMGKNGRESGAGETGASDADWESPEGEVDHHVSHRKRLRRECEDRERAKTPFLPAQNYSENTVTGPATSTCGGSGLRNRGTAEETRIRGDVVDEGMDRMLVSRSRSSTL